LHQHLRKSHDAEADVAQIVLLFFNLLKRIAAGVDDVIEKVSAQVDDSVKAFEINTCPQKSFNRFLKRFIRGFFSFSPVRFILFEHERKIDMRQTAGLKGFRRRINRSFFDVLSPFKVNRQIEE
jgi:hypothetical protein